MKVRLYINISFSYTLYVFYLKPRSRYLHVWRLSDQKLHHIVELPEKVKSVKQLTPLPQIFEQHSNSVSFLFFSV